MARKQARRRRQPKVRRIALPKVRIGRVVTPLLALLAIGATHAVSARLLDRDIGAIEISGPLQRVSALQIEAAIAHELDAGFLGADLGRIRATLRALPWIDDAAVARRWPNRLAIIVTEQVPAAVWGEQSLLNVRGELFAEETRHVPAELPRLSGPDGRSGEVARRYLAARERLIPMGLDLKSVALDERGAWTMTLTNGVDVRLGRRDVDARTELLLGIVADLITERAGDIDHVDMRYSNGFTVGWKQGVPAPGDETEPTDQEMLALRGGE